MTRKNIRAVSRDHDEATVESLRKDPKFAVEYLNAVLQDGDEQELMVAMRRIADAMGGVPQLASKTKLNATSTCADRRSARRCRRRIGPPPLSHGLSRFDRGRIEGTSLWRRWRRLYKSAIYGSNSIPSASFLQRPATSLYCLGAERMSVVPLATPAAASCVPVQRSHPEASCCPN
jgi:hypothetical protein